MWPRAVGSGRADVEYSVFNLLFLATLNSGPDQTTRILFPFFFSSFSFFPLRPLQIPHGAALSYLVNS